MCDRATWNSCATPLVSCTLREANTTKENQIKKIEADLPLEIRSSPWWCLMVMLIWVRTPALWFTHIYISAVCVAVPSLVLPKSPQFDKDLQGWFLKSLKSLFLQTDRISHAYIPTFRCLKRSLPHPTLRMLRTRSQHRSPAPGHRFAPAWRQKLGVIHGYICRYSIRLDRNR